MAIKKGDMKNKIWITRPHKLDTRGQGPADNNIM
jgi:hypothetical protein